ncbi:MAG TPA: metallophosphoesterase [Falsiroseomonas sp.]|nr:metallophosphoesterase [Falsiroseomonas sp.]
MPTRRALLGGLTGMAAAGTAGSSYAVWIEPALRLTVAEHRITSAAWPAGRSLTIAALSDIHAADPWMPLRRVERIVAATNALRPDMVALLGDFPPSRRMMPFAVPMAELAAVLGGLRAPLGVHTVLGNHDWWEDAEVQRLRGGIPDAARIFADAGLPVLHNTARKVGPPGAQLWVAGLGSLWAFRGRGGFVGAHDLPRALDAVTDADPVVLLCHEPDIFPEVPPGRVAVTLCGHTHGGQVRLLGYSPVVPSRYGNRYAWGHVEEAGKHLVVSGGLGWTIMPVRFGVPPEVTLVRIGHG